ncbi:hypothetical protein HBI55_052170 [Parastagonospora nodorum]|nr:hypothetical protein HBI55_052170 [Parastagonospora nodorum]
MGAGGGRQRRGCRNGGVDGRQATAATATVDARLCEPWGGAGCKWVRSVHSRRSLRLPRPCAFLVNPGESTDPTRPMDLLLHSLRRRACKVAPEADARLELWERQPSEHAGAGAGAGLLNCRMPSAVCRRALTGPPVYVTLLHYYFPTLLLYYTPTPTPTPKLLKGRSDRAVAR